MRTIETMTEAELREEVGYWREVAALWLKGALTRLQSPLAEGGADEDRLRIEGEVRDLVATLGDALSGRLHAACEACLKPVKPGQPVIHYNDVGEVHADCDDHGRHQAGDRIPLEADEASEPGAEPFLTVYLADPVYGPEAIAELLAEGQAVVERLDRGASGDDPHAEEEA